MMRLQEATNLGSTQDGAELLLFFVFVPTNTPHHKSAKETATSIASMISNLQLRFDLEIATSSKEVQERIIEYLDHHHHHDEGSDYDEVETQHHQKDDSMQKIIADSLKWRLPFLGIISDINRRLPWYISDWIDGVKDIRTIMKICSTVLFLYFSTILPAIRIWINQSRTYKWCDVN